jgi:hypothetical protein
MKAKTDPVLWWQPPFLGSPDRAIDVVTREFLAAHPVYTLGHLLAHLSQHVPQMRSRLARTHSHQGGAASPT